MSVAQQRWAERHGVTLERWNHVRASGVLTPYHKHRDAAKQRGIGWGFNPCTWFDVWEQSGKWLERGASRGKYVMARNEDIGPYQPGNVRIVLFEQNAREIIPNRIRKAWRLMSRSEAATLCQELIRLHALDESDIAAAFAKGGRQ